MLTDEDQIIMAMQSPKKAGGWDLAAEYVNNNLLSSPDTHIINIIVHDCINNNYFIIRINSYFILIKHLKK